MKLTDKIPVPHMTPDKKKRMIDMFNRYSLLIHAVLSMALCFTIETISRHSAVKALTFVDKHTWAFAYNSFIIFASLAIVYLFLSADCGCSLEQSTAAFYLTASHHLAIQT